MSLPDVPHPIRPVPGRRRVLRTLVPPKLFDFWAAHFSRTLSFERPLARVVSREPASADAVTLVLKANRHWAGCAPGQHVIVGAEIDGRRITRSYSPTRVDGRRFAITVKAIAGGKLSRHLCENVRVGDVLDLGDTFGGMALPVDAYTPQLFLAAGSGITPMLAFVRRQAARGMPVPTTLVYWARTRAELCFVDELRALAAREALFTVRFVLTREAAVAADEAEGRIDAASLAVLVPDAAQRHVFACGPGGFVETARALLGGSASFQAEAFTAPAQPDGEGGVVQVELARSGRTLTLPRGVSILAALEAEGVKPKSGCRMGLCNTCACGKRAGTTRHLFDGVDDSEPASALRICVNAAHTDLVLDL
jgi:ferredoxin-NADP reductase